MHRFLLPATGFFTVLLCLSFNVSAQDAPGPVDWVNTLMGTDSRPELSNGNTYPAVALPWGMNFWTPQTGKMGDGWQYTYRADKIRGFKQTHQPSPWMNDYGVFSLMAITGDPVFEEDRRASWFSHKAEEAHPYYYSVYLADHDVRAEITPTERAAMFRFSFPETQQAWVLADAFDGASEVHIVPSERKVTGYSTKNSGGVAPGFRNYFVMVFDRPFDTLCTWKDGALLPVADVSGKHTGALLGFRTRRGAQVQVRVASSFISPEQAERNLQELGNSDFETLRRNARNRWNEVLGKIQVEGGTEEQYRTFYSSLYRMVLFPLKLYEKDKEGNIVHYSPSTGKVMPGKFFAGTGFWDTFRALYPFLNLLYPSVNIEMQEGLVNAYKEGGWLPEWSNPGYRNVMIGNNSASVVADAYLKGLRGYDIHTLYEALIKGANHEGPLDAVGRKGVAYYNSLGYVPCDVGIHENAARTLEYAYDDYCIWMLAKELKRPAAEIALYERRCRNYRHLFDPETRLMRGKGKDGQFVSPFNPMKWGDAFTEGNSWHYTWSVFHDVQGLQDLMGGRDAFVRMLDSVFVLPPVFDASYYGGVIHEIREMQVADMGQYAHGNQPIQHMAYLYTYAGEPWKAQYHVREIMNRLYHAGPDGYCGDEDNGQTSAWYVFSALGFYPVCPGSGQYVLGTPLFRRAVLHLENGKTFSIEAPENGPDRRYIRVLQLNGRNWDRNWISHDEIMRGGELRAGLSAMPEKGRGVREDAWPYSVSSGGRQDR